MDLTIQGLDTALLPGVQDLATPSPPGHEGDLSAASVGSSQLQIGTRSRVSVDVWRQRFYSLAAMTQYFVTELANPYQGDDALLQRAPFLAFWPTDTDIAQPTPQLASQLLPYFSRLADFNLEPDL